MGRKAKYTDEMILNAAKELKAQNKEVSGWTIHIAMGGGKISRIEQVLFENEVSVIDSEPAVIEQVLSLPSQFAPQVEQIQDAIHTAACEMWRTSIEMAENRVKDEFTAANKAKNEALSKIALAEQVSDKQEEEITELTDQVETLTGEKKQLLFEQQADRQTIIGLQASNKSQSEQIEELRKTVKALENEVEKERTTAQQMRGQCQARENQVARLESQVDDRNIIIKKLEDKNSKLQEEKEDLSRKAAGMETAQSRIRELAQESGGLKQENKELVKQLVELCGELKALKEEDIKIDLSKKKMERRIEV